MIYYTGIGSRETPTIHTDQMTDLGYDLAKFGMTLRSGHADGADIAFEKGCDLADGRKEIYLPWKGFNNSFSSLYRIQDEAYTVAADLISYWDKLKDSHKHLHARNIHQIAGKTLTEPSMFVICWTPKGELVGGTATALKAANLLNIPVFNLGNTNIQQVMESITLLVQSKMAEISNG